MGHLGEPSQVAAGGRPLAAAAEVGREGGEGGAVREAARAVFESVREGAGLGLPGAVEELEAGDQVARAVLAAVVLHSRWSYLFINALAWSGLAQPSSSASFGRLWTFLASLSYATSTPLACHV